MHKTFLLLGSASAALAVMLGAFGAHSLKNTLSPQMLTVYHTAVEYHFYHALGLLLIGLIARGMPDTALTAWAGGLMLAGILLFSGSLYLLSITGVRWLGAITPLGGMAFIAAWLLLALGACRVAYALTIRNRTVP